MYNVADALPLHVALKVGPYGQEMVLFSTTPAAQVTLTVCALMGKLYTTTASVGTVSTRPSDDDEMVRMFTLAEVILR